MTLRSRRPARGSPTRTLADSSSFHVQLVSVSLLSTFFLAPRLPNLISATLSLPSIPKWSLAFFLTPIVQTSSLLLLASQSHLNHRQRTFGASYRIVAYLDLASAVLSALPIVLSGWWGRWEQMGSFGLAEVGWIVGRAGLAWQAWQYERVEQKEEGDDR